MKVKELIKLLKQAPQNIDVNIYDNKKEYLQEIDCVWIPNKEDLKYNSEVQLQINRGK